MSAPRPESSRRRPRAASRRPGIRPRRLRSLPHQVLLGREVPVAVGLRIRTLGLAFLDRAEAGPGLLIPRCAAVHTFGMRFPLEVRFLAPDGSVLATRHAVAPRRFVAHRGASAVLELPA